MKRWHTVYQDEEYVSVLQFTQFEFLHSANGLHTNADSSICVTMSGVVVSPLNANICWVLKIWSQICVSYALHHCMTVHICPFCCRYYSQTPVAYSCILQFIWSRFPMALMEAVWEFALRGLVPLSEEGQANSWNALIETNLIQSWPKMYKTTGFVNNSKKLMGVVKRWAQESGPVTRRLRLLAIGCEWYKFGEEQEDQIENIDDWLFKVGLSGKTVTRSVSCQTSKRTNGIMSDQRILKCKPTTDSIRNTYTVITIYIQYSWSLILD